MSITSASPHLLFDSHFYFDLVFCILIWYFVFCVSLSPIPDPTSLYSLLHITITIACIVCMLNPDHGVSVENILIMQAHLNHIFGRNFM